MSCPAVIHVYADLGLPKAVAVPIPGPVGPIGSTWLGGSAVPASNLGVAGDWYLRSNGAVYGPKTSAGWGSVVFTLQQPLSAAAAQPLAATATAGSSGLAADAGHQHPFPTAAQAGAEPTGAAAAAIAAHLLAAGHLTTQQVAGTFSVLTATSELALPSGAPTTPSAGDVYRVADTIRYRDSANAERSLLNATDNLANLASPSTALGNLAGMPLTFAAGTLTYAATVNLDMAALSGLYRTLTLAGNVAFTSSNQASGRQVTIRILSGASSRTLAFPAGWVFIGTKPASIAASKTAVLSLTFFGATDADCVAAYAVQG